MLSLDGDDFPCGFDRCAKVVSVDEKSAQARKRIDAGRYVRQVLQSRKDLAHDGDRCGGPSALVLAVRHLDSDPSFGSVIVNSTTIPHRTVFLAFLRQLRHHRIVIVGYDVAIGLTVEATSSDPAFLKTAAR